MKEIKKVKEIAGRKQAGKKVKEEKVKEEVITVGSFFKNKNQKILYLALFTIMLILFIYLGTVNFKENESDAARFSNEFSSVSDDNIFVYTDASEISNLLDEDCLVLFGSSLNSFTEEYANIINEVAKESGIIKILYYDFVSDRSNNNGNYELLVEDLNPYLLTDDLGNTELYAPTFLVVKDGIVTYINEDVNFVSGNITPSEYWTELQTGIFKETLKAVFADFIGEEE